MKNAFYLLPVLLITFSCQPATQNVQTDAEYQAEVKAEIARLDKLFYEAWDNEDLDSVMFFLDDGVINMFSLSMSMTWQECYDGFKDLFDNNSIEDVDYKFVDLLVGQDYSIGTGMLKQKFITNDRQDTTYFDMRGMTVWKKQEGGGWKVVWLMGQQ
jgi:ketosteroid isomerase-like protein